MRDLWRRGGGASKLTHRRALLLIEQLPPESRTKTAERDEMDPFELAEQVEQPRRGWGPHSRTDELLMQLGERLDQIAYLLVKTSPGGGGAQLPARWRRPGVLGAADLALIEEAISAPVRAQIEAERAQRARERAAADAEAKRSPPAPAG